MELLMRKGNNFRIPVIKAISYYLPEKVLTNEELVAEFPEWTVEKIAQKVGVDQRHIAADNETAADMAVKAAENLFSQFPEISREDVDFVILCTQSPDYFLPTSACIIQTRLGLRTDIGAFDFNLGCSGYVYGLAMAKGLIAGGIASNVLLLTAETYSKHLHPRDKGNRTIFGDGATATIVSTEGFAKIGEFALGTDGRGVNNLIVRSGGARQAEKVGDLSFDENGNPVSSDFLFMNGSEIFSFTQRNVPKVVKEVLAKNHLEMDDISAFIMHQANSYMLEFLRKKMKIEADKYIVDMADTGNTVSNSIPLVLARHFLAEKQESRSPEVAMNRITNNPFNILLCGFGVGYSWGATILHFT